MSNEERSKLIISELVKSSVRNFLIAPGSRSTPLTLAAAENPLVETVVHFDERGLAFQALGMAKAKGEPVCLICTSGSALMNFYPAIVEASMGMVPLVILSADRPPELRECGSNQTLDQVKAFGNYLRWEIDLATQDKELPNESIAASINQAVYRSHSATPGPVLVNCMFREPFITKKRRSIRKTNENPLPTTKYFEFEKSLPEEELNYIANELTEIEKGLIIVGNQNTSANEDAILDLAMKLKWPIFADPLSNLRHLGEDASMISHYNHILKTTYSRERMIPDAILHLGGQIVSKPLLEWLNSFECEKHFQVANFPQRQDPNNNVTDRIEMEPELFCERLMPYVNDRPPSLWMSLWKEYSLNVGEIISATLNEENSFSEPYAVYSLTERLGEEVSFFFGNSLSIRYADTFFFPKAATGRFFGNRGCSGIDGLLSTTIGLARGLKNRVVAVVGDLAFLHDLNSLAILKEEPLPITFVVLNNFGGGIFEFLPIAENKDHFGRFFKAEHSHTFEKIAGAFDISYHSPKNETEYQDVLEECTKIEGPNIIEVMSSSERNFEFHQNLENTMKQIMMRSKKEKEVYRSCAIE